MPLTRQGGRSVMLQKDAVLVLEYYSFISIALIAGTLLAGRPWAWMPPVILIILQLAQGTLSFPGAFVLVVYVATTIWMMRAELPVWVRWCLRGLWFLISLALATHAVPGIHNLAVVSDTVLKANSIPTSVYWNIDKVWLAWSLGTYVVSPWRRSGELDVRRWVNAALVALVGTALVMLWGMGSGLLSWQPGVPLAFGVFAAANLLNTCLAEELLFRGVVQRWLSRRWTPVAGWLVASALFGLVHLPASWAFAVGAFLAGLAYGAVYALTGRIWAAVLVHWALNLVHLLLFTYPVAA